jgi:hypothetical protein
MSVTRHDELRTFEREGYRFASSDRAMDAEIVDLPRGGCHINLLIQYGGQHYGYNLNTPEEIEAMRDLCNEALNPSGEKFESLREQLVKEYQT